MNTSVGRFECKSLGCDQYAGIPCLHKYPINKGHELFLLYTFAIMTKIKVYNVSIYRGTNACKVLENCVNAPLGNIDSKTISKLKSIAVLRIVVCQWNKIDL